MPNNQPSADSNRTLDNCPTCGGKAEMYYTGLELVENSGDETLATKNYRHIPSFEETQYESLKADNERLREMVQIFVTALEPLIDNPVHESLMIKTKEIINNIQK